VQASLSDPTGAAALEIPRAIEVFVQGFAFVKSKTHPYEAELLEHGIWVLRDAERRREDYRREEYVSYGVPAAEVDAVARRHTRGRFKVCAILAEGEPDGPLRAEFKQAGYRLMATEAFMVRDLSDEIERINLPTFPVLRVTTEEQAALLAKSAGSRQILPEHLAAEPPPIRQYMVMDRDKPVGWVGSVPAAGCAWCNNMYVAPEYRRRGIAKALLLRMLADDRAAGTEANVLLSSHAGSKLYPTVGYEQIGRLYLYTPTVKTLQNEK
jgi:GNAT superfamily N-acetyltransferase